MTILNSRQQIIISWAHMVALNQSNFNKIEISNSWPYNVTVKGNKNSNWNKWLLNIVKVYICIKHTNKVDFIQVSKMLRKIFSTDISLLSPSGLKLKLKFDSNIALLALHYCLFLKPFSSLYWPVSQQLASTWIFWQRSSNVEVG